MKVPDYNQLAFWSQVLFIKLYKYTINDILYCYGALSNRVKSLFKIKMGEPVVVVIVTTIVVVILTALILKFAVASSKIGVFKSNAIFA